MKLSKTYIKILFFPFLLVFGFLNISENCFEVHAATVSSQKKKAANKRNNNSTRKKSANTKKKVSVKKTNSKNETSIPKEPEEILNDPLTLLVNSAVNEWMPSQFNMAGLRVNSVKPDRDNRTTKIGLNENFTYLPVTKELIKNIQNKINEVIPDSIKGFDINLMVGDKKYSYYITTIDKLPEQYRKNGVFVAPAEPYVKAIQGMEGDIIALWPSHGRYFKPGSSAWYWQRPQLFQVTEDTHTMSYIFPYVAPMIENAGGYVLLPRERDINNNEVIVDNDKNDEGEIFSQPYYKEKSGSTKWETGEYEGFIYDIPDFRDTENPFENGTYRQTQTINKGKESLAEWYADIPEDGEYAIYVSYKTLPNSTEDALYTVNYSGGSRKFKVNQTMGGSTWIYLGTFPLEAGYGEDEPVVTLSNLSSKQGKIITADAIKIGGGMGNISRSDNRSDVFLESVAEDIDPDSITIDWRLSEEEALLEQQKIEAMKAKVSGYEPNFSTSGLPRYLEGARYWLHWAGFPEEVYSPYHGTDDYKDDYTSRGLWVNYLAGGSRVLPGQEGLNIPVDVSMALHSDAGKRADDTFIGTLGIYFTNNGDSYKDGPPRSNSRSLTDMLMRQITLDIRQTWEPNWTRRAMWDKSYVEARVPEVPTSLIEFMSHQNFADMKYALDPSFRFTVSRSIYKAIGRFVSERKDRKFVVQPLPVKDFAIEREKKYQYKLMWKPTKDTLEPTADPDKFLIFERSVDDLGFHKIGETSGTSFTVKISDNEIHSYKIIAANEGGISFPSEILALREGTSNTKPILIINGFDRISAPTWYSDGDLAGFDAISDFGVPYIKDISFIGYQNEFRRSSGESFGSSNGNYASKVIAGNTFDYPYLHGKALGSDKGFISTSIGAIENDKINLEDYSLIDLILGKQKTTITGNGTSGKRFAAFSPILIEKLKKYIKKGGDFIISGQYVSTELFQNDASNEYYDFATNYLGISKDYVEFNPDGLLNIVNNNVNNNFKEKNLKYSNTLNKDCYIVEKPDALQLSGKLESDVFLKFSNTNKNAGVLIKNGNSKGILMTIPFESINPEYRSGLMRDMLEFIEN